MDSCKTPASHCQSITPPYHDVYLVLTIGDPKANTNTTCMCVCVCVCVCVRVCVCGWVLGGGVLLLS